MHACHTTPSSGTLRCSADAVNGLGAHRRVCPPLYWHLPGCWDLRFGCICFGIQCRGRGRGPPLVASGPLCRQLWCCRVHTTVGVHGQCCQPRGGWSRAAAHAPGSRQGHLDVLLQHPGVWALQWGGREQQQGSSSRHWSCTGSSVWGCHWGWPPFHCSWDSVVGTQSNQRWALCWRRWR